MTKSFALSGPESHRAGYMLELGVWRATCRVCGWTVSDPERRRAASMFREHIKESRVIDLREPAGVQLPPFRSRGT